MILSWLPLLLEYLEKKMHAISLFVIFNFGVIFIYFFLGFYRLDWTAQTLFSFVYFKYCFESIKLYLRKMPCQCIYDITRQNNNTKTVHIYFIILNLLIYSVSKKILGRNRISFWIKHGTFKPCYSSTDSLQTRFA